MCGIDLETAVQDGNAMRDFESEGFPVGKSSDSKTCADLPSWAAVSRIKPLRFISIGIVAILMTGCHPKSFFLEPGITYQPQVRQFQHSPSNFPKLTLEESKTDWGRELSIAIQFARELDLYRAITTYKRALFLLPREEEERLFQIEYSIVLCYYLGQKYDAVIGAFEDSHLSKVSTSFPAFLDLVIILYDSYRQNDQEDKAEGVFNLLQKGSPETAKKLKLFEAIESGDIPSLSKESLHKEKIDHLIDCYCNQSLSVRKAQLLNAILPGAGYFYVGQKNAALTSFAINTSFIAASWYFFNQKNYGAAIITSSLELGWYIGGINGSGLAAKEWNQYIYRYHGKELLIEVGLFPVLMLSSSF